MKNEKTNNVIWAIGACIALLIGFLLCRYTFFSLHGMKQWPLILLIPGLVAIIVMAFFPARKVLACIPLGYIGGFAISMLFQSEGVDPGDGRTSNAWIIWTVSFLVIIVLSIAWELISKHRQK